MAGFRRFGMGLDRLKLDTGDMRGPVLTTLGQVHRRQQSAIFATEGKAGAGGKFSPLNPSYAARKRKAVGNRKILQLTGDMKSRFTGRSRPEYVQEYEPKGEGRGVFRFGARSNIAAAHLYGNPSLAAPSARSATAKKLFGGVAPQLPVRDMISKTPAMYAEFKAAFTEWYIKRARQVVRGLSRGRRA